MCSSDLLGGPLSHVMAAKAVALAEARQPSSQVYARNIADNAKALAEGFLTRGARLVTGGTDNHIVLLDVTSFGLTGRQAESALLDAGIVTNRNAIPADPNGAWYSSGIRFGTPALTTRGLAEEDMTEIASVIATALSGDFDAQKDALAERTRALMDRYPLYPQLSPTTV